MNPFLYFKVKWFLYKEKREVRRQFPTFTAIDRALSRAYRLRNPYRICKDYGETPLAVLATIAREVNLGPKDVLFDLGCGRGRGTLFLSYLTGCRTIGIDWVPLFIDTAQKVSTALTVQFRCEPIQTADLSMATHLYLYGTCLADEVIQELVERFAHLSPKVKIITVSYPLSDYSSKFRTDKQLTVQFPWGEGDVYFNSIIKSQLK
jgi:SAM-dependent methyltransferase